MTICREPIVTWDDLEDVDPRELWRRPLSTTQVAEELGVSDRTVRRWVQNGWLPGRKLGRNYQIPRALLSIWQIRLS